MRRVLASPTVQILVVLVVVFVVQRIGGLVGYGAVWFALADPAARPWTLVTSVYAHRTLQHLVVNMVALGILGLALERFTTRPRFHAFVLGTGMFAGLSEVVVSGFLGGSTAVLGISGAVLALLGYVVAANPATDTMVGWLGSTPRFRWVVYGGLALLVVYATAGPGVALVAHGFGFLIGLASGRLRLLRVA